MPEKSSTDIKEGDYRRPLLSALLEASARFGSGHVIASDMTKATLTYRQLFTRAFILSKKLDVILSVAKDPHPQGDSSAAPQNDNRYVGMLLPNSLGAAVTFVALQAQGRIPCMLNFTSGETNMRHACRIACVKTVLTSRLFVEKAKLEKAIEALQKDHSIIYLEDIRPQVKLPDKLLGALKALYPQVVLRGVMARTDPDDPAVILYTSGSEGAPKGVALSHANILSNIAQICLRLDFKTSDTVFNAMPVFHSFGLSVGMLMPLVRGIKTYLYPSPAHYKLIPPLVQESGATIMLGTDTFYNGYAAYSTPEHFKNVWLAVAGAEKLKESTRLHWKEKLGVDIFQGYGVTEASPVVSVNTPAEHRPGSVGRIFPRIDYKLEPVPGLEKGGRLLIRGPNIMLGYLKADKPGVIQHQGEWYDTGDIVEVDAEGYIHIQGRAKRFAKIAGEMVSLQVVEEIAAGALPDVAHAAIAVPDEKRGEQLVLFTESRELTRDRLVEYARRTGIPEIYLPRQILPLEEMPRLGNGKIDYVTLNSRYKP